MSTLAPASHPPRSAPTMLAVALGASALIVLMLSQSLGLPPEWSVCPVLALASALAWRYGAHAAWAAALGAGLANLDLGSPSASIVTCLTIGVAAIAQTYALQRWNQWQPTEQGLERQLRTLLLGTLLTGPIFATGFLLAHGPDMLASAWLSTCLAGALAGAVLGPGCLPLHGTFFSRVRFVRMLLFAVLALSMIGAQLSQSADADIALWLATLYLPWLLWNTQERDSPCYARMVTVSAVILLMLLPWEHSALPNGMLLAIWIFGPAVMASCLQASRADGQTAHEHITQQSRCDVTTGLLTDRGLLDTLSERLSQPQRPHLGLIGLNISNFAAITDLCGTLVTMQSEQHTASLLRAQPGALCAARLAAGRYAVLITANTVAQVRAVAREVYTQLSGQRVGTEQCALRLQVCVGALLLEQHTQLAGEDCLGALSDALGIAASVRDPQLFVEPLSQMMIDARRAQQAKVEHIRAAVRESRLELFAQALVDPEAPAGQLSYEILTRLRDHDGSVMEPPEFLDVTIQAQLSVHFDRAVIVQTLAWLSAHPAALQRTHRCSINLTGASVREGGIGDFIRTQCTRYQVPPERIVFEISEGEALRNPSAVSRLVDDLKAQGFGIALDDFGTGLATFEYLRRFPLDYIKIDGSFIRNLVGNAIDEEIVLTTVRVAQRLNLRTIAEHVHSQAIFSRLQELGVDFLQGDLFGRAQPLETLFEHFAQSPYEHLSRQADITRPPQITPMSDATG